MACTSVNDIMKYATESLGNELYQRARLNDIWQNGSLVEKAEYPANTGFEQTSFTLNNSEPSETSAWEAVESIDGETGSGACAENREEVTVGFDERVWGLERKQYDGPVMCLDETSFTHNPTAFIGGYVNRLYDYTKRGYSNRVQEHFISLSTKYFAGDSGTFTAGTTLAPTAPNATGLTTQPTSAITPDILEELAVYLLDKGVDGHTSALEHSYILPSSSGPLFTLYGGQQTIAKIFRADPDRREDIRYADMGESNDARLLKRLGATQSFGNFSMLPNRIPPRYTWNGSNLVRVPAFLTSAASGKGTQAVQNPAYQTAPYEAILIPNPLVMKCHVVRPQTGGLDFDPKGYMGDWNWVTGAYKWDTDCPDPLNKKGRHFAEFMHAIEPIFPDYGLTVFIKRCVGEPTLETCEGS